MQFRSQRFFCVFSWEQRKVVEVAPLQRGFDLPASQMKDGPYPVIMSNGVGGWHSQYKAKGPGVVTGRSGTIGKLHYIEDNYWPHNTTLWVTNFHGNNEKCQGRVQFDPFGRLKVTQ
jgi:type I restriction enzyme, S subunit